MMRKTTKQVKVGSLTVGGSADISVQSMLNRPAHDFEANIIQAKELETADCEIIRVSIPTEKSLALIPKLKEAVSVPIVADIHFHYKLALESVAAGADKIRINPGNIGDESKVKEVVDACRHKRVPIRIGVNSGAVVKELPAQYGGPKPAVMVESTLQHVKLLEKFDFEDIVLSIKSSHVPTMVECYEMVSQACNYPLHLGVTEAGTYQTSLIKSSAGLGALLLRGIGDTIRVSMADEPVREVEVAYEILKALGLRQAGPTLIVCPTCGRTGIDLIGLAKRVEDMLKGCKKNITVAVMGCEVNGPGEAAHADIGIAAGKGRVLIFREGKALRTVSEALALQALKEEIDKI